MKSARDNDHASSSMPSGHIAILPKQMRIRLGRLKKKNPIDKLETAESQALSAIEHRRRPAERRLARISATRQSRSIKLLW
jgi:hypothetical protein